MRRHTASGHFFPLNSSHDRGRDLIADAADMRRGCRIGPPVQLCGSLRRGVERMENIIGKLLQDYEHGRMTRRQLIQTLTLGATAAASVGAVEAAPANATYINHVSMQVADYRKTRDFYAGLFGVKVTND